MLPAGQCAPSGGILSVVQSLTDMQQKRLFILMALALTAFYTAVAQFQPELSYSPQSSTFSLTAPDAAGKVVLRLYQAGEGGRPMKTVKMKHSGTDRWQATVKGDLMGNFYTFEIQHGGRWMGETPGTFAKAVGINGRRAAIIDMKATNPEGWENDRHLQTDSPADLVIYELHHRDFSLDPSSGLQYKGKFLALTEPKAIRHFQELGINAVHILPSFDYASVDEARLDTPQYNWGYDPLNYNVPEGSYSTNPYEPTCRIREFKQMVMALHKAGIRVILDVVYNHTFDVAGSAFQRTYPDGYYRKTADGQYSNGSGCGNETKSEAPLMRNFMLESVLYWLDEYHIDGFRFDLMGIHDLETMRQIRDSAIEYARSNDIFIYGEGWSAGSCALPNDQLAMKANMKQLSGIAAFSDELRDALRGPFSDDTKGGFLAGIPGTEESIKFGIAGAIDHPQVDMSKVNYSQTAWAGEPTQMISYVSCHDDMCLTDRLKASIPGITEDELIRLDLLAQTAVFTSQGVPFMLSGEEMLRSKKGVHNSYNSPDSINRLDWTNLERYPKVFNYYKSLVSLRKNHPAFRLGTADKVRRHLRFVDSQPQVVHYELTDLRGIDPWEHVVVILNGNKEAVTATLEAGKYRVVCCDGVIDEQGMDTVTGGKVIVDGQSAMILYRCE